MIVHKSDIITSIKNMIPQWVSALAFTEHIIYISLNILYSKE